MSVDNMASGAQVLRILETGQTMPSGRRKIVTGRALDPIAEYMKSRVDRRTKSGTLTAYVGMRNLANGVSVALAESRRLNR